MQYEKYILETNKNISDIFNIIMLDILLKIFYLKSSKGKSKYDLQIYI